MDTRAREPAQGFCEFSANASRKPCSRHAHSSGGHGCLIRRNPLRQAWRRSGCAAGRLRRAAAAPQLAREREPGEPMAEAAGMTAKGEQTRALIMETALQMFMERGYEETTMRAIAERAGVALGSAYYYFRGKEQLIQAFYSRTHQEHLAQAEEVLRTERTLRGRLLGTMQAKLRTIEPYHRFSGVLFRT